MTLTAREWRERGVPIPSYVPDDQLIADAARTPDGGVAWSNSWSALGCEPGVSPEPACLCILGFGLCSKHRNGD